MNVTQKQLLAVDSRFPDGSADALNRVLDRYEINTKARLCGFLAQVTHESAALNDLIESLYYTTPAAMMRAWPRRFRTEASCTPFLRNPEKLANQVYANRGGNRNEASGDGWKYRGRGAIGVTFADNYKRIERLTGMPLLKHPELLEQLPGACESAAAIWHAGNLNLLSDCDSAEAVKKATRVINGGYNGLDARIKIWERAKAVFLG